MINSQKAIRYLGVFSIILILLIISAYFSFPALHNLSKVILVLLLIGLPLYLDEIWLSLFNRSANDTISQKYLSPTVMVLVSILASLVVVVASTTIDGKTAELPQGTALTAINLPDGMSASFGSTNSVKLIVRTTNEKWKSLGGDDFSAVVDVAKQKEGTYDLPISVSSKLDGVTIVRTNPSRVVVTVEPVIRKTVSVVVKFSGKAGNELIPDDPKIEPTKVEATGPKSVMTDLTQAVVRVPLNGETAQIKQKFTLAALTSAGEIIPSVTFNPTEIELTIDLVKAGNFKTLGIRPIITGVPSGGFWVRSITLDPEAISVTGKVELLNDLTEIVTEPISVAGLSEDATISATLALPSGITSSGDILKISVKVDIEQTATTKSTLPEIQYEGLSSSLKVESISPTSISLLVAGSTNFLNTLTDGSNKLKLNLSTFQSAGTYSITIKNTDFTLVTGASLVSYLPSAITVILANK